MLSFRLRHLGIRQLGQELRSVEPLLRWELVCRADVSWPARRAYLRSLVLECPMEKKYGIAGHHDMLWRPLEIVAETMATSTGPWSMELIVQPWGQCGYEGVATRTG